MRQVLVEAQEAGYEPRLLYQQAVQARPPDWPSTLRTAITKDQALGIATEHLGQFPVGARVRKVVAWHEITWRRPSLFNAPPGIEDTWVAYVELPDEPPMSRDSRIIVISRTTGSVLFVGDAGDEG